MVSHFGSSDLEVTQLFLMGVQNLIGKIWWIYSQKIYSLILGQKKPFQLLSWEM